ncbi:ComEC/Rec2 family competence protein [Myceligenerans pegani]|uniref:MBL fold metallo-hydrolase n=1 Tax=Myceligenerans pegani TaxID=2776917 RepID=A0ABR9MVS8_9MICO|nr:hypothetical protein [Myceligenerans sp. TRM 65318]MBE1875487.1 hypothetical protein [Myceligenerans sp. TRM 65318]MBE3017758.1 hypothetical protein [Myceligenerans sp. TRM 65318]
MYEVDFLPVEATDGEPSTRNGDAITIHFTEDATGTERVVVIDAGFEAVGDDVVEHVTRYYGTSHVDLAISTHPDRDHIEGMRTVVEKLDVAELMVHCPKLHASPRDVQQHFRDIAAVDDLIRSANAHGTRVAEPFTGESRFGGQLTILGPAEGLYETLLAEHLGEERAGTMTRATAIAAGGLRDLFRSVAAWSRPAETLAEDVETSARKETSVVTLIRCDGQRLLFTGDAGLRGLGAAADRYESLLGPFESVPITLFQVPHHGDRHNLSPAVLDRLLGHRGQPHTPTLAVASSADDDPKHPSPMVANALSRRGATLVATEGEPVWSNHGAPPRAG